MIFIISPGRCGSTLMMQLMSQTLRIQSLDDKRGNSIHIEEHGYISNMKTRLTHDIIHVHLNDRRFLSIRSETVPSDLIYYVLRKNLVEYIASHYIAKEINKYHWKRDDVIPDISYERKKLNKNDVVGIMSAMKIYYNEYIKHRRQENYKHVHLVYYEDFVKTFSSPEFTFHPESMEAVKTEKTLIKSKIDKKRYLDYDHLTDIVLQYNNGSIYFNPSN